MNYHFRFLLFTFLLFSQNSFCQLKNIEANDSKTFIINGTATGLNGMYLYLSYSGFGENRIWDSALVTNNVFTFSGILVGQWKSFIKTNNESKTNLDKNLTIPLYLEPGKMSIALTINKFSDAVLKGSTLHDKYLVLERKKMPIIKGIIANTNTYDSTEKNISISKDTFENTILTYKNITLKKIIDTLSAALLQLNKDFVLQHPSSIASLVILDEIKDDCNKEELENIFLLINDSLKNVAWASNIEEEIIRRNTALKGSTFQHFSAVDIFGDSISTVNGSNKYTLVTFWKSDYKYNFETISFLKKLYDKYHDKKIAFINISLDKLSVFSKDQFFDIDIATWKDIQSVDNGINFKNQFGIKKYPTILLINAEGMIEERFETINENDFILTAALEKL